MKKILIPLIIIASIVGLYFILSNNPTKTYQDPDLVLYWGDGCVHCETVKDYINKNSIDEKLKINQKEVFFNKQNQTELQKQVKELCPEIDNGQGVGVPLGIDPKAKVCLQGSDQLINFISQKTGQN